eukprot:CAMPEP_0196815802 /NCGR_PEP_ID=MMETSP1362-20130617/51940_1 /TAXON_ID=163516 /ORGANISM="Leptocylindrus danicus, Strain CCMP1856" /LENGTH=206 /DNA_ID=CAMNT_0042192913 /DNA_START=209 /DNA_END=829 /DNA_ORIENTATION=-
MRRGSTESRWRGNYVPPKKSNWDVRKSKTLRFKLYSEDGKASIDVLKKSQETLQHVLGKGIIWALHRRTYPNIYVERDIGDKRVPDVVAFEDNCESTVDGHASATASHSIRTKNSQPLFWGESGRMSPQKAGEIASKYPSTHFVHLRWGMENDENWSRDIEYAVRPTLKDRSAPFEFAILKCDPKKYIDEDGVICINRADVVWRRL